MPRQRFFARDLTLGLRWEFMRNWLIAAEDHDVDGTARLSTQDNSDLPPSGGDPRRDLSAMMLSFRF